MSRAIVFRVAAHEELVAAREWYESRQDGLGESFVLEVEAALELMLEFPEAAPVIHRGIRRQLLRNFPHGIFYVVEDERIVVLAVYHGRRNPSGWQDR